MINTLLTFINQGGIYINMRLGGFWMKNPHAQYNKKLWLFACNIAYEKQ